MLIHERTQECGHCWAEANDQPSAAGAHEQWTITLCDECDEQWPCATARYAAYLTDVENDDIDAVEIVASVAGRATVNVRLRPTPELIEFPVHVAAPDV